MHGAFDNAKEDEGRNTGQSQDVKFRLRHLDSILRAFANH